MKYIKSLAVALAICCGVYVNALGQAAGATEQSKWVFGYLENQQILRVIIKRTDKAWWDVEGGYAVLNGRSCTITGNYSPAKGLITGYCKDAKTGEKTTLDGYRNQDGTQFYVRMGPNSYTATLRASDDNEGVSGKPTQTKMRPCTNEEAAAFQKIAGSYTSYRMVLMIGGSCEEATGTFRVAEWCEGVNEKGNPQTERTSGSFDGRMAGTTLVITSWRQSATKNHPTNNTGTSGTCSIDDKGQVSCSGFGCPGAMKKDY